MQNHWVTGVHIRSKEEGHLRYLLTMIYAYIIGYKYIVPPPHKKILRQITPLFQMKATHNTPNLHTKQIIFK